VEERGSDSGLVLIDRRKSSARPKLRRSSNARGSACEATRAPAARHCTAPRVVAALRDGGLLAPARGRRLSSSLGSVVMAPRAAERHGWRPLLEPVLPLIAGAGSFAVTVGVAVLARVVGILRAPRRRGRGPGFRLVLPIPLRALDGNTVLVLGTFLIISVLVGEAATRASRRAISTERARGALATEQGALRRVATLVARQSTPGELFRAVGTPGGARVRRGAGRAAPGGDAGGGRGVAEEVFAAVAEEIGRRGPPSLAPALASWEAPFREVRGLWADVDSTRAGSDIRLLPGREPLRARSTRRNQAHADPDPHAPSVPGQLQTRGCLLRDSSWDRTTATRTGGSGRSRSTR
jgi:hypothetical protein